MSLEHPAGDHPTRLLGNQSVRVQGGAADEATDGMLVGIVRRLSAKKRAVRFRECLNYSLSP